MKKDHAVGVTEGGEKATREANQPSRRNRYPGRGAGEKTGCSFEKRIEGHESEPWWRRTLPDP